MSFPQAGTERNFKKNGWRSCLCTHSIAFIYTPCHTLVCKRDSMSPRTGMTVSINLKCEQQRKATIYLSYSCFLKATCPYGLLSDFIIKEKVQAKENKKKKRKERKEQPLLQQNVSTHYILYISEQHNAKSMPKNNMVTQLYCDLFTQRAFLLWLSYATCHWNVFFMLLISLNVKHLSLREPNPSDDFSNPLKWKWCISQNSGINIIKEFDLQKPQHLLAWRE